MKTIPLTLNDAINVLYSSLKPNDIEFIKNNDHSAIHFTGGMQLRNDWGLWDKNSSINKDIQQRFGLSHGDDCSGLIFTGLWAKVQGVDLDDALNNCAEKYKEHWRSYNTDPLTGEQI